MTWRAPCNTSFSTQDYPLKGEGLQAGPLSLGYLVKGGILRVIHSLHSGHLKEELGPGKPLSASAEENRLVIV